MSLLKKLAGETAIYGTSSILSRLLHYVILTPYFTRVFLQGEYGVVSDMYTWAALLLVLFTYRMETAFFRFGSQDEIDLNRSFSTASLSLIASTLVFVTLLVGFADPIAQWLHYPEHREYVLYFALIIGLDALAAIPFARLRLENRPIRFAIIKTGGIIINIISIFFFLELCPYLIDQGWSWLEGVYDPTDRIVYVFISNMIASAAVIILLLPAYFRVRLVFDAVLWRKMVVYALPLIIAGIAGVINQLIGIPLIKELASEDIQANLSKAGVYSAAAKIAVLMNLFTQAFNYAAEPFFFRNAQRSDSDLIYAQVGKAFAMVGSVVFLGIVLYLDLIQYFVGSDFREGLGVVPILLLAYFFLGLFYNFSIWYKLTDRTIVGGYIALGGAVITITLNFILIPNPAVGYFGPAWAALACYGFMALTSYWTGQKYHPIRYPLGRMLAYITFAVAFYFLSIWLEGLISYGLWPKLGINTVLMFGYLLILFRWEKAFIGGIFRPGSSG